MLRSNSRAPAPEPLLGRLPGRCGVQTRRTRIGACAAPDPQPLTSTLSGDCQARSPQSSSAPGTGSAPKAGTAALSGRPASADRICPRCCELAVGRDHQRGDRPLLRDRDARAARRPPVRRVSARLAHGTAARAICGAAQDADGAVDVAGFQRGRQVGRATDVGGGRADAGPAARPPARQERSRPGPTAQFKCRRWGPIEIPWLVTTLSDRNCDTPRRHVAQRGAAGRRRADEQSR